MCRRYAKHAFVAFCMLTFGEPALAATYTYTDIVVPGGVDTKAVSVNAKLQITGSYTLPSGLLQGYVYIKGKIRTFQAPAPFQNANITPTAIGSTGLVAGVYGNAQPFPFRLPPGSTTAIKIEYPPGTNVVVPTSISQNGKGDVAGYLSNQNRVSGFDTQANFTEFAIVDVPNAGSTTITAFAFSPSGGYERPAGNFITDRQHGWTDNSSIPIDPPASISTSITYFNNNGDLGGYFAARNGYTLGFVRRGTAFSTYHYPAAMHTTVTRNLGDEVFGEFKDRFGRTHGYHYINGQYQLVGGNNDEVTLTSVADDGSFVGSMRGSDGHYHGYLATCAAGLGQCTP